MTYLILQILGNSDILAKDGNDGVKALGDVRTLEQIQKKAKRNEEMFDQKPSLFNFPLIQKLYERQIEENKLSGDRVLFGIILTSQIGWMEERKIKDGWYNFVRADGIWWKDILVKWCALENNNIKCYPLTFEIPVEAKDGVADWEKMAKEIQIWVQNYIKFESGLIKFCPPDTEEIQIEKLIIQHSSGTPALSSALYLWGIERKIAGIKNIEFAYISKEEQDYLSAHQGTHWKWRLKDPQIRELLKIQDFSGALRLLDKDHLCYEQLKDSLEFLDKAVSLNLSDRYNGSDESRRINPGRDAIIERVSIALWSEKAFRDRNQWLHWYLRMAGAFELALLLLVEKQGENCENGKFEWKDKEQNINLFFTIKDEGFESNISEKIGISNVVTVLLSKGKAKLIKTDCEQQSTSESEQAIRECQINKINKTPEWSEFKKFYLKPGFSDLRNKLFHSLAGEKLESELFKITEDLRNKTEYAGKNPSQVAVELLNYIIELSGESGSIKNREKFYIEKVEQIERWLEWNKNG